MKDQDEEAWMLHEGLDSQGVGGRRGRDGVSVAGREEQIWIWRRFGRTEGMADGMTFARCCAEKGGSKSGEEYDDIEEHGNVASC